MIRNLKYYSYLLVALVLLQCKERFEPDLPIVPQGYLVVEGFINAQGPTQIKLSRSVSLDEKNTVKSELNATIQIQGEDNTTYSFVSASDGLYSSESNMLNPSTRYRLHIKTKDNKEYLSDFVEVKITPPMDSISWKEESDGVHFYVTTHDDESKSIYYRWEYDETWEIRSVYFPSYKYENGKIVSWGPNDPNVYYCWKYSTLTSIILQSSERLQKDIISLKPLVSIPISDERLGVRYSIQVRQYVLDKQGYRFYELLKKNTESLGTIFDPQPSTLNGNVHSLSDPNEIVIGYIGATTMQQKRIFIDESQIAGRTYNMYGECLAVAVPNHPDSLALYIPPGWPYEAIFSGGSSPSAYMVAPGKCVDCRIRGGSITKPAYW